MGLILDSSVVIDAERKRKPMVTHRAFVLAIMCITAQEVCWPQTSKPRYSITISTAKTTVKRGSELRIQIVQKNTTDKDQMFWVEALAVSHGEYAYLIDVLRSDGKRPARSKYFREVRDDAGNFMPGTAGNGALLSKKPGESVVSSLDLNQLYDLNPGKYSVQVYQNDNIAHVTVRSNIITVTVTP